MIPGQLLRLEGLLGEQGVLGNLALEGGVERFLAVLVVIVLNAALLLVGPRPHCHRVEGVQEATVRLLRTVTQAFVRTAFNPDANFDFNLDSQWMCTQKDTHARHPLELK